MCNLVDVQTMHRIYTMIDIQINVQTMHGIYTMIDIQMLITKYMLIIVYHYICCACAMLQHILHNYILPQVHLQYAL